MRLYDVNGRQVFKNCKDYIIDWQAPSRSKLQKSVKDFLYTKWKNHIVYEEFPVFGSRLKVDFFNATRKWAVEVHGRQHENYVKHFHGSREGYRMSIRRDQKKAKWLEQNEILLIEIYEEDLPLSGNFFIEKYNITL